MTYLDTSHKQHYDPTDSPLVTLGNGDYAQHINESDMVGRDSIFLLSFLVIGIIAGAFWH